MREAEGLAIFCEDIRFELGGKVSYMGIFGNDMVVSGQKPIVVPKLCIAAHIRIPSSTAKERLKVVVFRDQDGKTEELVSVDGDIDAPPPDVEISEDTFTSVNVHLSAIPFEITGDADIKVRAYVNDIECKLGILPIRFVDPPTE